MGTPTSSFKARQTDILDLLERLHRHKNAAYGDAWRKRGEVIAIFANMARKYDRLIVAFEEGRPAVTESLGDTVGDLCVYSGKYLTWIAEQHSTEFDTAELPVAASSISDALGPAALVSLFQAVQDAPTDPLGGSPDAWQDVQVAFRELERGLMIQATLDASPENVPSYARKAQLGWDLVQNTTRLLCFLENEDPMALTKLRDEVAAMDQAAGHG